MEDVEFLRGLRFSWTKIASIIGVSRSTLYRRLQDEGISLQTAFTCISNEDLDRIVLEIKRNHPNSGERLMIGHLQRLGIIVQRYRLRASIHRVDPVNTAARRSLTIRRRTYSVAGPNEMWHVDGNHKLIRWRLVIHGAVDGYSRTITFLRCSNNNRASTVLDRFTEAVRIHGLPSCVRTDLGGENTEIWRYMIEQHNSTNAVITGSSTHNERVERLWRDYHRCVGVVFADTFRQLEEEEHLDSLNEIDLYCLHYVFIPRIDLALKEFIESWNNHPLSSCGNFTPNQLFVRGAIEYNITPQLPQNLMPATQSGNPPTPQNHQSSNHVAVPQNIFQPCNVAVQQLSVINPLAVSDSFGRDIYMQAIYVLGNHLRHCTHCL